jgi:hypothetical protein
MRELPAGTARSSTLVGLGAALLAALLAWPVPLRPDGMAVGGGGGDMASIAWGLWRVASALPGLPSVRSSDILFPDGASLLIADLPEAVLMAPVTLLVGPVAAVNLLQLLHVGLAAGLTHALLRRHGASTAQALPGAIGFGFCLVMLSGVRNGNADVTPMYLLPLVALLAAEPWSGVRSALLFGLAVGLSPWINPYVGVMAGITALCLASPPRDGRQWRLAGLAVGLAGAVGGAYVALARASLTASDAMVRKTAERPLNAGIAWLRGYVWPEISRPPDPWTVHAWYLGGILLLLALAGAVRLRWEHAGSGSDVPPSLPRPGVRWALLGLVGLLLSLGPALHWSSMTPTWGGRPMWMPWAYLSHLPGIGELKITYRYGALVALATAWFAGRACLRMSDGRAAVVAVVVAADLLYVGGGAGFLAAGAPAARASCGLLEGRPPGPVIELPGSLDEPALLAQTCHGNPAAEGINRRYARVVERAVLMPSERVPDALRSLGFRYIVVRNDDTAPPSEQRKARFILETARRNGETIVDGPRASLVDLGEDR